MNNAQNQSIGSRLRVILVRLPALISSGLILVLMLVTTVDVIGRNVFNSPLPGGYELTAFSLMTLFFLSFPLVTLRDGHITVNLIDNFLGKRGQRLLSLLFHVLGTVTMGALAVFVTRLAFDINRYGDLSLYLQIPKAPFIFLAAFSIGLTALIFAARIVVFFFPGLKVPNSGTHYEQESE